MIIHDLRSPADSIYAGLVQAKKLMNSKFNKILKKSSICFNT